MCLSRNGWTVPGRSRQESFSDAVLASSPTPSLPARWLDSPSARRQTEDLQEAAAPVTPDRASQDGVELQGSKRYLSLLTADHTASVILLLALLIATAMANQAIYVIVSAPGIGGLHHSTTVKHSLQIVVAVAERKNTPCGSWRWIEWKEVMGN